MPRLELWLLVILFAGVIVGGWGIWWVHAGRNGVQAWGWSLCVAALLKLGISSWVAAWHRAEGLVPLGVTAGLLLVGMLWEGPRPILQDHQSRWPERP